MDSALFDFINRQQIYVEGVKNWHARDFNRYLTTLADAIRSIMSKLGLKQMGDLSKAKFNNLLRKIADKVNLVMGQYGTDILAELQKFSRIDLTLQRSALAFIKPKIDLSVIKIGGVWSAVKDTPVAALGANLKDSAVALAARANASIRQRATTSYADNESVEDATSAIVGTDQKYTDGVLKRIGNDARNFIRTAFQHVTATVSDKIGKLIYDCYQWISVIDNATSDICRSRNGAIFQNGEGPLPPAHNNCRSRTLPCECRGGKPEVPTFYTWLKSQPLDFIKDAFGDKAKASEMTAADLGGFTDYPPISLDEFELKAPFLKPKVS